jgi:hypothetical protein
MYTFSTTSLQLQMSLMAGIMSQTRGYQTVLLLLRHQHLLAPHRQVHKSLVVGIMNQTRGYQTVLRHQHLLVLHRLGHKSPCLTI